MRPRNTPGYEPRPTERIECRCGDSVIVYAGTEPQRHGERWKKIGGRWHCPRCAQALKREMSA